MRNNIAAILHLMDQTEQLKPLTIRRPTATLPFACRYRLIDFPFSSLYYAQVTSAALFLSGSGHSVYDHIRSGSQWGLDSLIGGGVFMHTQIELESGTEESSLYYEDHKKFLDRSQADYILLMGGKIISNINIRSLMEYCTFKDADAAVIYKKMPRSLFYEHTEADYFTFDEINGETITGIKPLKEEMEEEKDFPVSLDTFLIRRSKFEGYLMEAERQKVAVSPSEIIRMALLSEDTVIAFEHYDYTRFVETINDFYAANMDMLDENNFFSLFNRSQPVITKVKNGAPTYYGEQADVTNAHFASDCAVNGKVTNSMVHRKTKIETGADVSYSVLTYENTIEEDVVLKHVILDHNVTVKKGVRLIGTPESPLVISKNKHIDTSIIKDEE